MDTIFCTNCSKSLTKRQATDHLRVGYSRPYCSNNCHMIIRSSEGNNTLNCGWCSKPVRRNLKEIKKSISGKIFCDRSCAASYNNTRKRKSRRSKCEILLFELLQDEFSELNIIPNDKRMLDGYEVDIAIPSLKLSIEWNGIVHFKPIYGQSKLDKIQERDAQKQKIAYSKDIHMIVIPDLVSTKAKVKEAFLDICKIIHNLNGPSGS